ncbi:MAG: SCO family protein [Planctomycetes bacterium]|nr:SCO family protein [Planctomycetota bacterium]
MQSETDRQTGVVFFFWVMMAAGIGLFAMVLVSAMVMDESSATSRSHEVREDEGLLTTEAAFSVPTFRFENVDGGTLSRDDLLGKVWVADLIFTNCTGQCSTMSESMATLQGLVDGLDDVRLVSISVDPGRDTAEVLRAYATRHGADPQRWSFLRGSEAEVRSLSVDGFKLGSLDDILLHSSRFVLVDRAGRIRRWYDGMSADEMQRLARHVRLLLEESGS